MAGLELVRPIIIWILLSQESFKNIRSRIKRAFVLWIPYLLLFLLFIVWRFFLMPQSGTDRNDPVIIQGLLTAPLKTIGLLISYFFQDLTVSLFSVWNKVIDPSIFDLTRPADAATWAFIILTGAVLTLAVLIYKNDQSNIRDARMMRLFIFLGLSGIVFGLLPGWAIGRYLNNQTGIYNDRFGIPAMIGAAMVIVGCCWYFIGKPIARNIFLISLVALSIGWNIRNTNNYRWSWIKQERFYWQLAWRAPSLEPGVPILSDGLIFPYMGTWTTSFAINLMYPENQPSIGDLNHWFFDINKIDLSYANENNILSEYHNTVGFSSTMDRLLIVQYLPENGSCLWFLKPEDTDNRFVTELSQDLAENIDLSAVHTSPVSIPADDIFGKEPPHEWCYYFQKADLAYQYQNWDEIMRLLDEVEAKTYQAEHGLEYMPFIGGLVHENRFDDALRLSLKAIEITEFTNEEICKTWAKESNPNQPIPQDIQDELRNQVGCSF